MNSQRLSDNSIDLNEKLRTSIYLKEDTYLKIDSLIKLKGRNQSRNDVIENAVDFYFGYITSQLNQDYLCGVFGSKMDMHTRMMASVIQLNKDEYDKLRIKSIHDVKTTNGSIDILEAANESEDET